MSQLSRLMWASYKHKQGCQSFSFSVCVLIWRTCLSCQLVCVHYQIAKLKAPAELCHCLWFSLFTSYQRSLWHQTILPSTNNPPLFCMKFAIRWFSGTDRGFNIHNRTCTENVGWKMQKFGMPIRQQKINPTQYWPEWACMSADTVHTETYRLLNLFMLVKLGIHFLPLI